MNIDAQEPLFDAAFMEAEAEEAGARYHHYAACVKLCEAFGKVAEGIPDRCKDAKTRTKALKYLIETAEAIHDSDIRDRMIEDMNSAGFIIQKSLFYYHKTSKRTTGPKNLQLFANGMVLYANFMADKYRHKIEELTPSDYQ